MAESTAPCEPTRHAVEADKPTGAGAEPRAWKPRGPAAPHWLALQRLIGEQAAAAPVAANASASDASPTQRITIGL